MRSLALLFLLGAFGIASADEVAERKPKPEPRIPQHSPEWTNPSTGDPGMDSVAEDLQKIVVLCAADHSSPEFKRAWANYVRKNKLKGAQLEATKRKVINEAFQHRQQFGQTGKDRKDMIQWKKDAQKSMDSRSIAALDNMRDEP